MYSFGVLFIAILATLYVAFMYESTAIMLLVYMEVAFFVVSLIMVLYGKRNIKGRIEAPINISEVGKDNLIKIIVENTGIRSIARVKALVTVDETICGVRKKYWVKLPEIPKGETHMVRNITFSKTGNYEIELKKLRIYDMTGLLFWHVVLNKSGEIQIMPEIHDVPVRMTISTKNFYGESDTYDEHSPGYDSSQLFQVRGYQMGDRLQNVHWKLSAKHDDIMVKEHSLPKAYPVVFFLDYRSKRNRKSHKKMMAFLEAAVSISFSMMDAGCPHFVVWYDSEEGDIKRVRVDDEESLFHLMGAIMKVRWHAPKEKIKDRYKDKYRMESYIWQLSLDESLCLMKGDEAIVTLSYKKLSESLANIEILL